MLKRVIGVLVITGVLAGCNTVAGFGRDMEKLGNKIENKAEQKKSY